MAPVPTSRAPLVFATFAALASALDALAGGATAFTAAMAGSLGAGLGLFMGGIAALLTAAARRFPLLAAWGAMPAAGAGAGIVWADALGAFTHLADGHVVAGGLTLAAATLAGAVTLLLPGLLAPTARFPGGPALASGVRLPALVLALGSLGILAFERTLLPPFYPAAHAGAAVFGLLLGSVASWLVTSRVWPGSVTGAPRRAALVCLGTVVVGMAHVGLGEARYAETGALLGRPLPGLALRFGRLASDVDGDGSSAFLGGGDCAPWDATVHPLAREVPDNSIDDNCVAGDARSSARVMPPPIATDGARVPLSVVLLTIDTLRPDRTTAYDPGVSTTPHLGLFGKEALRFERAYSAGMSTNVAMPALLSGMYPRRLRWKQVWGSSALGAMRARLGTRAAAIRNHGYTLPLDDPSPLLAERLTARGMHTMAVVDDGGTFLLRRETFGRGFADFREVPLRPGGESSDADTARLAVEALEGALAGGRPFFLWVHAYGPHDTPPDADLSIGATPREYDRAIAQTDAALAPLVEALGRASLRTPLATFVTADHGEGLRSWMRGHGGDLFGGVPRVPLLVRAPGVTPGVTGALVSLVDLVPTVLALTGTRGRGGFDGVDLTDVLLGRARDGGGAARILLADAWIASAAGRSFRSHAAGALDGRHVFSMDLTSRARTLFALSDEGLPPRNRIQEVDPRLLEHALVDYLESTAGEPALY